MKTAIVAALALLALAVPAFAAHAGHDMSAMPTPGSQQEIGTFLRHAMPDGYMLMYKLLTWEERKRLMGAHEGMEMPGMDNSGKATNHLVVDVTDPAGKQVKDAKVGFQITGPDGKPFNTLTMFMPSGYGADVNLKAKGIYKIRTKAQIGAKAVNDEFTHEVK
jgi:hypothetical protein